MFDSFWRLLRSRPAPAPRREADEADLAPTIAGIGAVELASAIADPLILFDRHGRTLFANDAARTSFGPLALGGPIELKFRTPEMQDLFRRITAGEADAISVDYAERVPIERWFRVTARRVGGGEAGASLLLFRDQSEARRIDRMRADFIANASHELRTPLASIAGFVETLRGPARDDVKARDNFLGIMQGQTARMARLIDDLLSLSRLEMKVYLAPGERVDLASVLGGVVDALAPLAAESGVEIERRFEMTAAQVAGSRDELIQVFENLLENAIKYGQSGGRVVVGLETVKDEITATIQDFGPGIEAEHIPRITERFYRVDVQSSRAQRGTGLGLSIVKHIVTRHNARLTIRSEPGQGATFSVSFPRQR